MYLSCQGKQVRKITGMFKTSINEFCLYFRNTFLAGLWAEVTNDLISFRNQKTEISSEVTKEELSHPRKQEQRIAGEHQSYPDCAWRKGGFQNGATTNLSR